MDRRADQIRAIVVHRPEIRAAAAIVRAHAHVDVERAVLDQRSHSAPFDVACAEDDESIGPERLAKIIRRHAADIAHLHRHRPHIRRQEARLPEYFALGRDHAGEIVLHHRGFAEEILHLAGEDRVAFLDRAYAIGDPASDSISAMWRGWLLVKTVTVM